MALPTFPSSPSNGDTYTTEEGTIYTYSSAKNTWTITGTVEYDTSMDHFISWDSSSDTYVIYGSGEGNIHRNMRRCVMNDDLSVNYYLDPKDSNFKADGATPSVLDGTDGQVMVEIPKFYVKKTKVGDLNTWYISEVPKNGYALHPAFMKNDVEVDYRYYGAYDACYLDTSTSPPEYKSGLNLDDMTSNIDTSNDVLASVSGVYPIVGITRAEGRSLAANRGAGWRQIDFYLISAVQLLFLVEYGTFFSQAVLGAGNTEGSYVSSSSNQSDSPHTISGVSAFLGDGSTNAVSGAGVDAKPGTSFMCYRGIENFFGNCWNWVDGANVNSGEFYVSNNDSDFADDTSTNYTSLGTSAQATGYVVDILDIPFGFIPSSTSGGSSTTHLTDQFYYNSGWRVLLFGGSASPGADAGAFFWSSYYASSISVRRFGSRLAA